MPPSSRKKKKNLKSKPPEVSQAQAALRAKDAQAVSAPAPARSFADRFPAWLPLAVILLVGAFLRFYSLGARALEWDEMLVPMAAHHNLSYIFDLCSSQETHPPLFYLLIKTVLAISSSDAALRFLSALFGVGALYLLYRVTRELLDEGTALIASAFLSVNVLHLVLSRYVRPYSMFSTLFLLTCLFIIRLVRKGRWRDLVWLCGINFLLFWIHYLTFHLVIAQGLVLAFFLIRQASLPFSFKQFIRQSSPFSFAQFATFCIVTILTALPVFTWFVRPSLAYQLSSSHLPRDMVLHFIGVALKFASFFGFWGNPKDTWFWLFPLAGCVAFLIRKPKIAALCLFVGAVPLAIVYITAPGYPLQIWHICWLTPLFALCAAMTLSWLPWRKTLALTVAVGGALFVMIFQYFAYYQPAISPHIRLDFSATVERLTPIFPPGALIADAAVPGFLTGLSWYFDKPPHNPLTTQRLEPGNAPITLHFLSGALIESQGSGEPYIRNAMGRIEKATKAWNATVYTFQVDRKPVTALEGLPASVYFSANPQDFYSRVYQLNDVRTVPVYTDPPQFAAMKEFRTLEGGVTATKNNQPASFEFVLANAIGDKPMNFVVNLEYLNDGVGNRIGLFARFDDEPPQLLVESIGPDAKRARQTTFSRNKPFTRLTLLVRMYCDGNTARFHGDNLRTLLFQGLSVTVSGVGPAAPLNPSQGAAPSKSGD